MVDVVEQLCVKNYRVVDTDGEIFTLKQGKFYTTTVPTDWEDNVTVFSRCWLHAPKNHFVLADKGHT